MLEQDLAEKFAAYAEARLPGAKNARVDSINRMAVLGYCERLAWSEPIPTGRHGEYISVMTRKRTIP